MTFFDHFQWYNQNERLHTHPAFVSSTMVPILDILYSADLYNIAHIFFKTF